MILFVIEIFAHRGESRVRDREDIRLALLYAMFFPPPARYCVPLLVLVFGFATTGLDYELNLARNLNSALSPAPSRESPCRVRRGEAIVR